jgi:formylglycine-generating enzyme required for sulfatase activity
MGKSSLLNAGVIPEMIRTGWYRPLRIRFNAYNKDIPREQQQMPDQRVREMVRGGKRSANTFLDRLIENEETIWHDLKEQQILGWEKQRAASGTGRGLGLQPLLLLFDQFEELFTYPPDAVYSFRRQLAEALYTPLPTRYWDMLELYGAGDSSPLSEEEQSLLETALDLRIVMAIRQDRLHLLGELSDYLPTISRTWFELQPLGEAQALEAITLPAAREGDFLSPPFSYDEAARKKILQFLTNEGKEKVESTQLQIVCHSMELKVAGQQLSRVTADQVGDLKKVIEDYYLEKINALDSEEEQWRARKLVEEGLVYDGEKEARRLSLYEGVILEEYKISHETLRKLTDSHLLRAEPSLRGGYMYELSHDTLISPVLEAKARRLEAEQKKEEEQARLRREQELAELREKAEKDRLQAEKERQLRQTAQRQRLIAIVVSVLALILALAAGWSYRQAEDARKVAQDKTREAQNNAAKEEAQRIKADQSANVAAIKTKEANENFERAEKNLEKARAAEEQARVALEQVKKEKDETDKQRENAEKNFQEAQAARELAEQEKNKAKSALEALEKSNGEVVKLLLNNADKQVLELNHEAALNTIRSAASLKASAGDVAGRLFEMAFWFSETGETNRARGILDTAAALLGRPIPVKPSLRETLEAFDAREYKRMQERYYPSMSPVEGGTFIMGCDTTIDAYCMYDETHHPQELSDFKISKYETTWWQYALYCKVQKITPEKPGWGADGDNPAVNVSWYDGAGYANWLSKKSGLDTVYAFAYDDEGYLSDFRILSGVRGYRLPTEAEWEYAARGGTHKTPTAYAGADSLRAVAWFSENSGNRTQAVGSLRPNALELYDMSGNVWEWCQDWYDDYPDKPRKNYPGPDQGSDRVLRGGSWDSVPEGCRVANRGRYDPDGRYYGVGVRLVLVP